MDVRTDCGLYRRVRTASSRKLHAISLNDAFCDGVVREPSDCSRGLQTGSKVHAHQPWDFFFAEKRCQLSRATDLVSSFWFITASLYDAKQSHLGDEVPLGSTTCVFATTLPPLGVGQWRTERANALRE